MTDVVAVAFIRGDTTGRGVRKVDVARRGERHHVISHRGRAYPRTVLAHDRTGANRSGSRHVLRYDHPQHCLLAFGELVLHLDHTISTHTLRVLIRYHSSPRVSSNASRACHRAICSRAAPRQDPQRWRVGPCIGRASRGSISRASETAFWRIAAHIGVLIESKALMPREADPSERSPASSGKRGTGRSPGDSSPQRPGGVRDTLRAP